MRLEVAALAATILALTAGRAAAEPAEASVDPSADGSGARCWFAPGPEPSTSTSTSTPTSTSTSTSTPTATATSPLEPQPPLPGPIRPILLFGVEGHERDGIALAVDLGLRFAPVTARWAYRVAFTRGGYVELSSGRLGWIFAENRWAAGHVALGAGRLTYVYDDGGPSARVNALTAEAGVLFGARELLGPALGLYVEALAPWGRSPDPRNASLAAPRLYLGLDVNLLALHVPIHL